MNVLMNPAFWLGVPAVHVLLSMCPAGRKATAFGAFNGLLLAGLIGWRPAVALFLIATLLTVVLRVIASRRNEHTSSVGAVIGIVVVLAVCFLIYKVSRDYGINMLGPWRRGYGPAVDVLAALSFSYLFLRLVDAISSVARGEADILNPISMAGYLAPFHMLAAGPVTPYREYSTIEETGGRTPTLREFVDGLNTVTSGLFYKFVIAESLKIFAFGVAGPLAAPVNLADTAFLLVYIFFDFAGYSRVALGIGRITGVPTPENFRAPFAARSVGEFWTRWHISLGSFVSRNIYVPLQLTLVRRFGVSYAHQASLATLLLAFGFVGLWHRVSGRFLLWGLFMGAILCVEKIVRDRSELFRDGQRVSGGIAGRILGPVYVFATLTISLHFVMREFIGV